jgi:hypothetical protein
MDLIQRPWTAADKGERNWTCTLVFLFRSSPGGTVHDGGAEREVLSESIRSTSDVGEPERRRELVLLEVPAMVALGDLSGADRTSMTEAKRPGGNARIRAVPEETALP